MSDDSDDDLEGEADDIGFALAAADTSSFDAMTAEGSPLLLTVVVKNVSMLVVDGSEAQVYASVAQYQASINGEEVSSPSAHQGIASPSPSSVKKGKRGKEKAGRPRGQRKPGTPLVQLEVSLVNDTGVAAPGELFEVMSQPLSAEGGVDGKPPAPIDLVFGAETFVIGKSLPLAPNLFDRLFLKLSLVQTDANKSYVLPLASAEVGLSAIGPGAGTELDSDCALTRAKWQTESNAPKPRAAYTAAITLKNPPTATELAQAAEEAAKNKGPEFSIQNLAPAETDDVS